MQGGWLLPIIGFVVILVTYLIFRRIDNNYHQRKLALLEKRQRQKQQDGSDDAT